jgi:hypothetical protein
MSAYSGPAVNDDGLAFAYDMYSGKSFIGGPVTNTLPSPAVNGLPTYGNSWGTYNTNQYNGNAYFSIGTIASVTSNIVATSGNHPLRSYDVVTPQTTGGGVTAGTNYLVKKLSNTTFSLHPWNSSQDGSQGFINPATGNHKVYDDFANDVRISVNATSFPTMWWGPPHLANSALVKEIIPNGFTGIPGRPPTDCIRLHFNRTDATDGMAYGPDASVTAGVLHTVSFWARSVTPSAVGTTGSYQIYNYGATTPTGYSIGYTLGPVGVWQKYVLQFTPNNPLAISYWFPGGGGQKHDIANIQFESGSVANNFAAGTRTSTQSILDVTGNHIITANNLTYSSTGTFNFNGSTNRITGSMPAGYTGTDNTLGRSWEVVVRPGTAITTAGLFGHVVGGGCTYYCNGGICIASGRYHFNWYDNAAYQFLDSGVTATNGQYAHIIGTWNPADLRARIYVNGELRATGAATNLNYGGAVNEFQVGYLSASNNPYTGTIDIAKYYYNKTLSATEVQQNFNAIRNRFGI